MFLKLNQGAIAIVPVLGEEVLVIPIVFTITSINFYIMNVVVELVDVLNKHFVSLYRK